MMSGAGNFRESLLHNAVQKHGVAQLNALAANAFKELPRLNVPSMQDDEWRFLDLTSLTGHVFLPSSKEVVLGEKLEQINKLFLADTIRIVLVNGYFSAELSDLSRADEHLRMDPRVSSLDDSRSGDDINLNPQNFFTCLNQSFFSEELCLNVVGELVEKIHLLHVNVADTKALVVYPRTKVVINKNCSATLIEDYVSFTDEVSLTDAVTKIVLQEDGRLNHTVLQRLAKTAFYVSNSNITLAKNATYDGNIIVQGGRLSRSDVEIELNGINATANLHGLTLINGRQISDVKTVIKHNVSDCKSNQLHKSIVDNSAHSIFNGKILVAEGAMRSEAHQQNRSLMLSTKARITTEPKLEINNDDVVCTHGATVSQMDEDILFFLKSRGIDQNEATKLCVNAFLHEIISKIPLIELQNAILATGTN